MSRLCRLIFYLSGKSSQKTQMLIKIGVWCSVFEIYVHNGVSTMDFLCVDFFFLEINVFSTLSSNAVINF